MNMDANKLLTDIHDKLETAAHDPALREELRQRIRRHLTSPSARRVKRFAVKGSEGYLVVEDGEHKFRMDGTEQEAAIFSTEKDARFWLADENETVVELGS